MSCQTFDELDSTESQGGPIEIDRDLANGFESSRPKDSPITVSIEVASVLLGSAFWISDPQNRIPFGGGDQRRADLVPFPVVRGKAECKLEPLVGGRLTLNFHRI